MLYFYFTFTEKETFGANWRFNKYISVRFSLGFMVWFLPSGSAHHSRAAQMDAAVSLPHKREQLPRFLHDMKWEGAVDKQAESRRKA